MSVFEAVLGTELVDGQMQVVPVDSIFGSGKIVGLYFSAHHCGPCRRFTPLLAALYTKLKSSHPGVFEVVFISEDFEEATWKDYFAQMPWLALPFQERDRKDPIGDKYEVKSIPTLVLLDAGTGAVINDDAYEDVDKDPDGTNFPWRK